MIIVGAYPDQVIMGNHTSSAPTLMNLKNVINAILPCEIALHVLPFYHSCGDGGFAITDWDIVEAEFGRWEDVDNIASNRKVIIDGVFNHLGMEHKFVKMLMEEPDRYSHLFHVNPCDGIDSPRGVKSNCKLVTVNGPIIVRKTHSQITIDVNLEDSEIQEYISKFISLASNHKVYGVRLDAVAYYKKGTRLRHNEGSYELANHIASMVKNYGLHVIAQIDADAEGKKYFRDSGFEDVVIYDFGYSAALSLAIGEKNPCELAGFLQTNHDVKRPLIRAPRTHDGILIRSGTLSPHQVKKVVELATRLGIPIREANGMPYELNCSLPFLIQNTCPLYQDEMLEMTIVLTGILNSIPYFYLPFLVGFVPENLQSFSLPKRFSQDDPRTLNRIPFNWNDVCQTKFVKNRLPHILEILIVIHKLYETELISEKAKVSTIVNKLLRVITAGGVIDGVFNFSEAKVLIPFSHNQNDWTLYSNRLNAEFLEPGGYSIWVKQKTIKNPIIGEKVEL